MTVSDTAREAAFAQETDEQFLVCLVLDHASFALPVRVVNDRQDLDSGGATYTAYPFDIELPEEGEDGPPQGKLVIDNVSQEIIRAVRAAGVDTVITVEIFVVRRGDPDVHEMDFPVMEMRNIQADVITVSGVLQVEDLVHEPYPSKTFSPQFFPGLF